MIRNLKEECKILNSAVKFKYRGWEFSGARTPQFLTRGEHRSTWKNLSEQRRESTTNSTHIWRRRRDLNPGHISGKRALSPLHHPQIPCSIQWLLTLMLLQYLPDMVSPLVLFCLFCYCGCTRRGRTVKVVEPCTTFHVHLFAVITLHVNSYYPCFLGSQMQQQVNMHLYVYHVSSYTLQKISGGLFSIIYFYMHVLLMF